MLARAHASVRFSCFRTCHLMHFTGTWHLHWTHFLQSMSFDCWLRSCFVELATLPCCISDAGIVPVSSPSPAQANCLTSHSQPYLRFPCTKSKADEAWQWYIIIYPRARKKVNGGAEIGELLWRKPCIKVVCLLVDLWTQPSSMSAACMTASLCASLN